MKRIMIIGAPGSGKSTLARRLSETLALPVFHMDREVHWFPGWQDRPAADKPALVASIIARDEWVFEGGHSSSYTDRLTRAEVLVWLDVPTLLRLWRVVRRTVQDRGRTRPDMQDDCPEELHRLPEFIRFILRSRRRSRTKMRSLFEAAIVPKYRLTSLAEVNQFVANLEIENYPLASEKTT